MRAERLIKSHGAHVTDPPPRSAAPPIHFAEGTLNDREEDTMEILRVCLNEIALSGLEGEF